MLLSLLSTILLRRAELVSADGGRLLDTEAAQLVGGDRHSWRGMFRSDT